MKAAELKGMQLQIHKIVVIFIVIIYMYVLSTLPGRVHGDDQPK